MFDLVLVFGVDTLMTDTAASQSQASGSRGEESDDSDGMGDVEQGGGKTGATTGALSIVAVLKRYLDSDDDNLRSTAVEGFAKLLLHNHLSNAQVCVCVCIDGWLL